VPFFADLPLIGWMFKSKTLREEKRELLIFITPRVVRQEVI
jgi:type IV pilus assembly protein PilQ